MEILEDPQTIDKVNSQHSVFSHFLFAWKQMWKYFLELLLIAIISVIVEFPTISFVNNNTDFFGENFFSIDLFIISFKGFGAFVVFSIAVYVLFILPLEYGIANIHLLAARGEKFKVKDMFKVFDNYWNAVFANILTSAIIGFGFMLLIIPGIIFACKLSFVSYLIVDKKMEAVEAVKTSWNMTSGYSLSVFFIGFFSIFIFLFGLLAFLVGIVVAIIWVRVAFASVYLSADLERNKNIAVSQFP